MNKLWSQRESTRCDVTYQNEIPPKGADGERIAAKMKDNLYQKQAFNCPGPSYFKHLNHNRETLLQRTNKGT